MPFLRVFYPQGDALSYNQFELFSIRLDLGFDFGYNIRCITGGLCGGQMVNKDDKLNNQLDEDIQRSKVDILRAKDLVPPFGAKKQNSSVASGKKQDKEPVKQAKQQDDNKAGKVNKGTSGRFKEQPMLSETRISAMLKEEKRPILGKEDTVVAEEENSKADNDASASREVVKSMASEDTVLIPALDGKEAAVDAGESGVDKKEDRAGIPEFDLAEEIMAEQRKIIAVRRKSPVQKTIDDKVKPAEPEVMEGSSSPRMSLSRCEQIIAKIVANDIEQLCNPNGVDIWGAERFRSRL